MTAGREDARAHPSSDLILTTSCRDRWGEKFSEFYRLGNELRVERGPTFQARLKSQSPLVAKPLSPGRDPVRGAGSGRPLTQLPAPGARGRLTPP